MQEVKRNELIQLMLDSAPMSVALYDNSVTLFECNMEAVRLFEYDSKEKFIQAFNERFFDFSEEYQPCGTPTTEKKGYIFGKAASEGRYKTQWSHRTADGKELPTEAIIIRIDYDNDYMLASYVRDLREAKEAEKQRFAIEIAALEWEFSKREVIPTKITKGSLLLDVMSTQAYVGDNVLDLTKTEFKLLYLLMQNEDNIITYETIYETIWKRPMGKDKNSVQAAVKRLRQKIEPAGYGVHAIRGKGYVFERG